MNPGDANYCCYCSLLLRRGTCGKRTRDVKTTPHTAVEISPKLRDYLYGLGMTDAQYDYLVEIGSYVSVGDHSEFEKKVKNLT